MTLDLMNELRIVQQQYAEAIEKYNMLITTVDASSMIAQRAYMDIEVYRERYNGLRMRYERLFGNEKSFSEKLQRYYEWRKEVGLRCLVLKPFHLFAIK